MAMIASSSQSDTQNNNPQNQPIDCLQELYPAVNEQETPLPRSWSPKDKYTFIGLSQNNLRVHYKGVGKTHKDAASVRATHPIPASCGVYYFEVKVISKGRDGYMGIGLCAQGVNMNRLPGWDKHSYGYHGDDGHSFCSSGTGIPYGPTFTTGDVVGCCVNLIDNTCFYTRNGVHLGIAFRDLPPNLYPTVGLQTPGEVVEANFGQAPFCFDIQDYMREWQMKTRQTISRFPVADNKGEWQRALQKIVSTYLVHHGYCATAESFARSTGQAFEEELASIKNRQRIQKLVLAGRMGEAIETTQKLYPGLLERSANLLFMLKCRQFIEMVNGTDSEVRGAAMRSPRSRHGSGSSRGSPSMSPVHGAHPRSAPPSAPHSGASSPSRIIPTKSSPHPSSQATSGSDLHPISEAEMNATNSAQNGSGSVAERISLDNDVDMDDSDDNTPLSDERTVSNGTSNGMSHNSSSNGTTNSPQDDMECDMDVDPPGGGQHTQSGQRRQLCGGNPAAIERMLQYGRELQTMSVQLKQQYGKNPANKKALQEAFSLLAYQDPWNSPVGFQLDPVQREPICAALNSAILESHGLPKQPPLELAIAQTSQCMQLMSKVGVGSCAFASMQHYLH